MNNKGYLEVLLEMLVHKKDKQQQNFYIFIINTQQIEIQKKTQSHYSLRNQMHTETTIRVTDIQRFPT